MADKDTKNKPDAAPGEPGSEEWEKADKVLRGEVEPGTADLPNPADREDDGDDS